MNYLSHLFGHEGENSLFSYLKEQGLALKLSSSGSHEIDTFSRFDLTITLSEKGLKEYEKVIEAVFLYATKIEEAGPKKYIFDEIKDTGIMNFQF